MDGVLLCPVGVSIPKSAWRLREMKYPWKKEKNTSQEEVQKIR